MMGLSLILIATLPMVPPALPETPSKDFSFFVTSTGSGRGADFGGLAGADSHCQRLAEAVGAGAREWRAYLSTAADGSTPAVHARDRIGKGPWFNVNGVLVAKDADDLHGPGNNLNKQTALTEKGGIVQGIGDERVDHDILTGSQADGTAFGGPTDKACRNWTSHGEGSAQVGHHDRTGGPRGDLTSWNSAHATRGCSPEHLTKTGGSGLFYCFASR